MYLDPQLLQWQHNKPDKLVDVILVCPNVPSDAQVQLLKSNFQITNIANLDAGLIYGRLLVRELELLKNLLWIQSVVVDGWQRSSPVFSDD